MISLVSIAELNRIIEEASGKRIYISVHGEFPYEFNHKDMRLIKYELETRGFKFIEARHIHGKTYMMDFKYQDISVCINYEEELTIDDEISELESKLAELKARKEQDGEG